MNTTDILFIYEYDRWANSRLLQMVSRIGPENLNKQLGSSYGSIKDTLTHILSCESDWLMRWKGITPNTIVQPSEFPDFQSIQEKWMEVENDQRNFVSKLSDEVLQEPVTYEDMEGKTYDYPLWQMIHHLVNHSTYHRGQVVTMLRQIGADAISLDFLDFIDESTHKSL